VGQSCEGKQQYRAAAEQGDCELAEVTS